MDSPHTHPSRRCSQRYPDSRPRANGLQAGQTNEESANEQQSLQPSPQGTTNEGQQPSTASSIVSERQQSQTALQSDSPETQRNGHCIRRKNEEAAAPSKKHQKTSHQVDGTSFNTRQSKRDRHLTSKATKDR